MAVKSERVETVTYKLSLTQDQANWLRSVMQNPLHGQSAQTELLEDVQMRLDFFEALKQPE